MKSNIFEELNTRSIIPLSKNEVLYRRMQWMKLKHMIKGNQYQLNYCASQIYKNLLSMSNPIVYLKTTDDVRIYEKCNFHGGCHDHLNTREENLFHFIFDHLNPQVPFGTGKGGYKLYGVKRYVVDFVDPDSFTIIEIDGRSHNTSKQTNKDKIRNLFFQTNGYYTIRFSNEDVLNITRLYCKTVDDAISGEYKV